MHLVSYISVAEACWPVKIWYFFLNTSPLWYHLLVHATMKMKAVSSSPALLYVYHITWYYIPEARGLDAASYFAILELH